MSWRPWRSGRRREPLSPLFGRLVSIVVVALALGCGGDDDQPPTASPTSASSADPDATSDVARSNRTTPDQSPAPTELGPIVWTVAVAPTTNEPTDERESLLTTDATIYAVVLVRNARAGTTLSATWSYNEIRLDGIATSLKLNADAEMGWIEFHLTRAPEVEWPRGVYAVTVTVDGGGGETAVVEVRRG